MSHLIKILCCVCVVLAAGCGTSDETGNATGSAPLDELEGPLDVAPGQSESATGKKPAAELDMTVYPIEQILEEVQSGKREASLMALAEEGKPIRVRGVIADIDPYQADFVEETAKPTVKLESGLLDLYTGLADSDILIECVFNKQEELKGLTIGQTIELSGLVSWTFAFNGPKTFRMERCDLLKAEPAEGGSMPFYSFEASVKDYGDEGEKLKELLGKLDDAGLSSLRSSFSHNMSYEIEVGASDAGDDGHLPKDTIQLLNEIPLITKLGVGLFGGAISDTVAEDLQGIRYCPRLEVNAERITGAGLASLLQIPGVHRLRLESPVTLKPEDCEAFQHVPLLRKLEITGSFDEPSFQGMADEALARLKYTPELRNLRLWNLPLTDDGLSVLAQLPHLRSLDLADGEITGSGLKHLEAAGNFWSLKLRSETVNDNLANSLAVLKHLVCLEINCPAVTSKIGAAFPNLPHLKRLSIVKGELDSSFGESLAHLPELEQLTLSYLEIGDDFKLSISSLPKLTHIDLQATGIGGNVCEQLGTSTSLEDINLMNTPVTDDDIGRLVERATDSKLASIRIDDTQITEKSLVQLAKLSSLKRVIAGSDLEISDATQNTLKDAEIRLDLR